MEPRMAIHAIVAIMRIDLCQLCHQFAQYHVLVMRIHLVEVLIE